MTRILNYGAILNKQMDSEGDFSHMWLMRRSCAIQMHLHQLSNDVLYTLRGTPRSHNGALAVAYLTLLLIQTSLMTKYLYNTML